jgi:hypothetical protein
MTAKFPHCDSSVMHSPRSCEFCDHYPAEQQARIRDGINFTGEQVAGKKPCPSDARRGLGGAHLWYGNVPETKKTKEARNSFWAEIELRLQQAGPSAAPDRFAEDDGDV